MDSKGGRKKELYVALYPQKPNCAVLYWPGRKEYRYSPLHPNEMRSSWRKDVWQEIKD